MYLNYNVLYSMGQVACMQEILCFVCIKPVSDFMIINIEVLYASQVANFGIIEANFTHVCKICPGCDCWVELDGSVRF